MVVFACNACGESLCKNKVDKHLYRCRTQSLSCLDCLKDFTRNSYSSHLECITEDQKYGGKNYKAPELKGKNKQNAWVQKVKTLIQTKQFPAGVQHVLKTLMNYDNIPRKKAKFINFVKNSVHIRDERLISQTWEVFESALKQENGNQTNESSNVDSQTNGNGTRNLEAQTNGSKRKTEEENHTNGSTKKIKENNSSLKIRNVIKHLLEDKRLMPKAKLQSKVVQFYNEHGYTDDNDIVDKFNKVILKKCFTITDNMVYYAN